MAKVPFDSWRLYTESESGYGLWLNAVLTRADDLAAIVAQHQARQAQNG